MTTRLEAAYRAVELDATMETAQAYIREALREGKGLECMRSLEIAVENAISEEQDAIVASAESRVEEYLLTTRLKALCLIAERIADSRAYTRGALVTPDKGTPLVLNSAERFIGLDYMPERLKKDF